MRIEIICTGDEVLSGKIINSNFSYLSRTLSDYGFEVRWETTVGDQPDDLLEAFELAGQRADVVIVNGGLGPTVDDLSQEVSAKAAGVELVLNEQWLERIQEIFKHFGRDMPPNNQKQAMLPVGAELIDNPIGTACGFALDIKKARFYFTPGVPTELKTMMQEQIIPRLLDKSGQKKTMHMKRFHTYGLGESHGDALLNDVTDLVPETEVKLGFQAHFPQLETKLIVYGNDLVDAKLKLSPIEEEVRRRLGDFIIAEDDQTLESNIINLLKDSEQTVSVVEMFTGGLITSRLTTHRESKDIFKRAVVCSNLVELIKALALQNEQLPDIVDEEYAQIIALAAREKSDSSIAIALLVDYKEDKDRSKNGGTIYFALSTEKDNIAVTKWLSFGYEWVRLGATEMGLDALRRYLQGLPTLGG